ncbi:hypothetical protein [Mycobacterium asiaticum]|uniref:hypothetical protein n=1 Tax=Mycobacterium asiaticum TaxID=1790 RepID=UPI0007EEF846|nr:hypothetical protein [Mycobacterium asiaticum]OBI98396.1 hypothetical protein A5661_15760 [Mycobacterium asiaticum]
MFGIARPLPDLDEELEYLPVEDCAERMAVSVGELQALIRRRAVACRYDGWGGVLARPTLVV